MALEIILALLTLLLVALAVSVLAERWKAPYTVLLVVAGSLLVPLAYWEPFRYLKSFELSPDLLFFVFLPILIFESAYNMNIRRLADNARAIGWLSVMSLLISAFFIGAAMWLAMRLIGFEIPFIVALLFGSLISATDPVAVLALFKEYGVPRRLALIFEGESLFNDGTSLALFLVVLEVFLHGYHGVASVAEGVYMFSTMMVGGLAFGLLMGVLFAKLIGLVKDNEAIEITLTMLVAHLTFVCAELLSRNLEIAGQPFHLSGIIATVTASIVIGNYGRSKISPKVEEYMERFWGYFAFVANSLVFLLMGILFVGLPIDFARFALPIALVILIVALGRALSVYPVVWFLNRQGKEAPIPETWQHLLAWGSLRGALALMMALLIPADATLPGWAYDFTVREFVVAVTIGCIYFTLLIKATTIGGMIKRYKIDALHPFETFGYHQSRALVYEAVLGKLNAYLEKGYINSTLHQRLRDRYQGLRERSLDRCCELVADDEKLAETMLRLYALGVEKHYLRQLFAYGELNEAVYKRILNKLAVQSDRVERGETQARDLHERYQPDWIEQAVEAGRRFLGWRRRRSDIAAEAYMYYRAQVVLIGKVIRHLETLDERGEGRVFGGCAALGLVIGQYRAFEAEARRQMEAVFDKYRDALDRLNEEFAERGLFRAEEKVLQNLLRKELVTPKLYAILYNELEQRRD